GEGSWKHIRTMGGSGNTQRSETLPRERCLLGLVASDEIFRRMANEDHRPNMSLEDFESGIAEYAVTLEKDEAEAVFKAIDKDGSGTLDINEFIKALRPPMPKEREDAVLQAFQAIDQSGDGEISTEEVRKYYNPKMHPMVRRKKWTEERALEVFLKVFETPGDKDGKVTLDEFINFYCNVSASTEDDEDFFQIIKNVWKI
uniref:EF-hand domain-containing protein n=1 Tax=Periophthalmus magnuspinnatus TaxID=409849 RepID=A0A3B4AY32_9GOBI